MENKLKQFFQKYKTADVIFKASIWFVLVSVIDNAISILTQPFINRILTVEDVGVYNIYNTWLTVFRIIATFNLFCGVYEVLLSDNSADSKQVRGSLCVLSLIVSFVFFGIFAIFAVPISNLLGLKIRYLIIMAATIVGEALLQSWLVPKRFEYKYISYSVLVVGTFFVKSVLTVLLSYLFVNDRVLGRVLGLGAPTFLVSLIVLILILKDTKFRSVTKFWKQALIFNLPLIPHYLSSILLASSDKVMIKYLVDESSVGLYSVVYAFSSLSLILFNALNSSYTPWAYSAIKDKRYDSLAKRTNFIVLISIAFCILLMLFAPEGVYILGGEDYMIALNIVPTLIVGTFFSSFYFIFSNVEFIHKKNKLIFLFTIGGTAINIVLNYFLIPIYGYKIAALTTLIGYLFIAVCHYINSYCILKQNIFDMKAILFMILVLVGFSVLCSLLLYKIHFAIRYAVIAVCLMGALAVYLVIRKRKQKVNKESEGEGTDD